MHIVPYVTSVIIEVVCITVRIKLNIERLLSLVNKKYKNTQIQAKVCVLSPTYNMDVIVPYVTFEKSGFVRDKLAISLLSLCLTSIKPVEDLLHGCNLLFNMNFTHLKKNSYTHLITRINWIMFSIELIHATYNSWHCMTVLQN